MKQLLLSSIKGYLYLKKVFENAHWKKTFGSIAGFYDLNTRIQHNFLIFNSIHGYNIN
jgi:hypothetical protein